jgi:hypothetical protein
MVTPIDRLSLLRSKDDQFTGIDFVHVVDPSDQTILRIYFHTDPNEVGTVGPAEPFSFDPTEDNALLPQHFVIRNVTDPAAPNVEVVELFPPFTQDAQLGRFYLEIRVKQPGDFADYRLRIDDPAAGGDPNTAPFSRIDPFFNDVKFSFKAGCPSELDCVDPEPVCPPEERPDFPIDYLARDFTSFRNALLDFAAQRYPEYTLPIEADVGVMLAEVMAALGDEFSYMQDRYAREAFLETANQRRSLRKKARLLDFEIHDGQAASTFLELVVNANGIVPAAQTEGFMGEARPGRVWAATEDGEPIAFEIGTGIRDASEYAVRTAWNASQLTPYVFDDSQLCLEVGATELFLMGALMDVEELTTDEPQRVMLLRTDPENPAVPARRHFVRIETANVTVDPLNDEQPITRITWDVSEALPFQLDLQELRVSLNIVPATAGRTTQRQFICAPGTASTTGVDVATEREGPLFSRRDDRPSVFLFGLPETETTPLAFLGPSLRNTVPEVLVFEQAGAGEDEWTFQRSMLAANAGDEWFTLEDGIWQRIIAYHRNGVEVVHQDYASGEGFSVRFGDGVFGRIPADGTVFRVVYRVGGGSAGNVPAGSINRLFVPGVDSNLPLVDEATNPVEVTNGVDPETQRDIKQIVPEAYRADILFAVRPEDFGTQAEKLDFIQRAHGTSRWTGSWTSMFVAGDPFGALTMTPEQFEQLGAWMDCVRQAGRDVIVTNPKTLPIDLVVTICVEPFAYAAQVQERVVNVLVGSGGGPNQLPFFHPDNFTFGMPLRRSALEAAIHGVPGVRFVNSIRLRERGQSFVPRLNDLLVPVDPDQVIRLDADPLRPGNGTLQVLTEGGA